MTQPGKRFPARLHVLLASHAPTAVILRRGPANAVCAIGWDLRNDDFTVGQWLRGRIYERRSDLSPDGRHLIYFARNARWSSETRGSWTAISRAPHLKALTLWGKGDCWLGGGLFTSNRSYWLNGAGMHFPLRENSGLRQDSAYEPEGDYGAECPSVYYRRLQRNGWTLRERRGTRSGDGVAIFELPLPYGWLLRKLAHEQIGARQGKSCYWDEHELENPARAERQSFSDWEWASLAGNALCWAEGGCLYRAPISKKGLGEPSLLRDFNAMEFEKLAAPY